MSNFYITEYFPVKRNHILHNIIWITILITCISGISAYCQPIFGKAIFDRERGEICIANVVLKVFHINT